MQTKLVVLVILILLAFVAISFRIISINRTKGAEYKKTILAQQDYVSTVLPYKRGDILDSQGTKIAYSEKVYNLIVDSYQINHITSADPAECIAATVDALSRCFPVDAGELSKHISTMTEERYYVLLEELTYDEISDFLQIQADTKNNPLVKGVWFEEEYKRVYPFGSMAADAIGFTTADSIGTFGLEEQYNSVLNGVNGRQYGYLNEEEGVEKSTKEAEDGRTIVSTIDVNIQSVVEKCMIQWNKDHEGANAYRTGEAGSKNTGVIVMNPKNGEVLAMASYPNFDLNNPRSLSENSMLYSREEIAAMDDETYYDALNAIWRNFCISDTYEPGSVAKALTISAALDSGAITGNETYNCGGVLEVGGHKIHCHKRIGHGTLTVSGALEQSCNVALMHIGRAMGSDTLMEYLSNFNIGLKTNIDLAGEARTDTLIFDPETMGSSDLAISTFGQGYNVTMIQMAAAFSSVINGGYYYQPHMVSEIRNPDGSTYEKIEPRLLKQTISESTSERMREYLTNVCVLGTGKTAVPAGYVIGGKTGTAEMYPRGTGNYVVSFCGFAPVDDPQVLVYVVVDRPNVDHQPHSTFPQEICKNIMTEVLPYMQIFRTEEISEEDEQHLIELGIIPSLTQSDELNEAEAQRAAENGENPDDMETTEVSYIDQETGYAVDPNTGEYL
ncbi:MAG: hypothetical protein K6G07_00335, partial [Lachnospiraceae bacterium]|nr:hypothetical protein [Lachnospiraceae bacterium]